MNRAFLMLTLAGFAASLGFGGSALAQTASDDDRFEIVLPDLSDPEMGLYRVSKALGQGLYKDDLPDLIAAANAGDVEAQAALSVFYLSDARGLIGRDFDKGLRWAKSACDRGVVLACINADFFTATHEYQFTTQDKTAARDRLSARCDEQSSYACSAYAFGYYLGAGAFDKDLDKALALYEMQCGRKDAGGCNMAGTIRYRARVTSDDLSRAAKYYAQGCELGYSNNCMWAMDLARIAYGEKRFDQVRNGAFPPGFKTKINEPWKFWPEGGFWKGGIADLARASINFRGTTNFIADAMGDGADPRHHAMLGLILLSEADEPSEVMGAAIDGTQGCNGVGFAECLNIAKSMFQGGANPGVEAPDWDAFAVYCDEKVELACSMLEFADSYEGLMTASKEEQLAAFAPVCQREDDPNVLACRLAASAAERLGESDPRFYPIALDMRDFICGDLTQLFCKPFFSDNPFYSKNLATAFTSRDYAALELAITHGVPLVADVWDGTRRKGYPTDFVAQAIIEGDRELLAFFAQRLDLDAYRVGGKPLWQFAMPTAVGSILGDDLYYTSWNQRRSMSLRKPTHEPIFVWGALPYKLTPEQSIERIEMLLDLGLSPEVGETGMTVYDLYDKHKSRIEDVFERIDDNNAFVYREVEERKEMERRRIAKERADRRAMNDAILRGMQQGLSESIGRMNSENRRNSSYDQLQEKHRAMAESYRARSSNLTLRTYSAPDTSQFEREQRERQRAQNAQNCAAIEEQRRKNAEFRRQNPQYYGPREENTCMTDGIGTACPL